MVFTLGQNAGIVILLVSVIVIAGCTSTTNTQQASVQQESNEPRWISGFDFCSFLGGSSDCRTLRMFCLDDMGEPSNYDYSKYLRSESCYQYDVTYVQFWKKEGSNYIPDSDGQLARMEAGRPYWCQKDWAKRELAVCEAEAKASPPPPEPTCGECERDECLDSTTRRSCLDIGGCKMWNVGKCVPGTTCRIETTNNREYAICR